MSDNERQRNAKVRGRSSTGTPRRIMRPSWSLAFSILVREADKRLKALILFTLLFVLLTAAAAALTPILLKLIVDGFPTPASMYGPHEAALALICAYAASHWLSRSLGELRSVTAGRADQGLQRRLSLRLFKHVMALPLQFHLDRKTGALSQTLTNGLLGYRILIQHLSTTVLPVTVELATMSIVLVLLGQPVFLWIIGTTLLFYIAAFLVGAAQIADPARSISTAHINANALLTDSILNYETVKSFCFEDRVHRRMEHAFAQTETHWARLFAWKAKNGVLVATIFAISLATSVYVATRGVQEGTMTVGDFVLVNTYMLQIFRPMEALGFAFRDIAQSMAFIERMLEVLEQEPEAGARISGRSLPPGSGELVFDRISFGYADRPVLRDVSFTIPAGRTVALVGASGAGKSSLIRLLVRFCEPDHGKILLDGTPISEISASTLRAAIAVVPQDTVLFNDSISYNIAIGNTDSSTEEVMDAARLASIHDFIIATPDGYDTMVGERGLKLSGGEKQRIAIARAALKKPRVFVFDEATSSLDSTTEQQILRNLEKVAQGTTTLVIAHRLSTIVNANEILVLEEGRIVERGTHRDLLRRDGVYCRMWRAQRHRPRHHVDAAIQSASCCTPPAASKLA